MTPEEAAAAARVVKPKYVYPYHSRGSDLAVLSKALEGSGIEVRLRDWYQAGDEVAAAARRDPGRWTAWRRPRGNAPEGGEGRAGSPSRPPPGRPPSCRPRSCPDQRVTFRLRAPNAKDVTITGDFWLEQSRTGKLVKDDQGVWSITVGPFFPDVYSYAFTVDGMCDSRPGERRHQARGLPRRRARSRCRASRSRSSRPGRYRTARCGSSTSSQRSPAASGACTSTSRPATTRRRRGIRSCTCCTAEVTTTPGGSRIGRANLILDNLIAQGKAKPMIVVMPSIWAMDPPVPADRRDANNALFAKLLFQDVMPYVEKHYRVLASPAGRAFGGLSYPNILPDAWIPNIEKFNYVGFTSNGLNADRLAFYEKQYPGVLDNPANVKRVSVYIGDGVNAMTFASAKYLADDLKRRGYKTVFSMTNGIHGWPWFRRYFAEFAQIAFQ